MATFFIADTHFGHANLCGKLATSRPFATIEEHDETLIRNWNEAIGPDDECWHLGDFAYRCHPKQMRETFNRLNGRKHLVAGNHDSGATKSMPWESVHEILEFSPGGLWIVACHYPFRSWPGMEHGAIHLHGHSHGNTPAEGRMLDVGVDCHGFKPVSLDTIRERMDKILSPKELRKLARAKAAQPQKEACPA